MTNAQHANGNLTVHLKVKDYATWRTGYDGREKSRVFAGTQTPAIPIRSPGSFDVHRTRPTYRPSSTYVHRVLGSCLAF
jgi:hypothetical protein